MPRLGYFIIYTLSHMPDMVQIDGYGTNQQSFLVVFRIYDGFKLSIWISNFNTNYEHLELGGLKKKNKTLPSQGKVVLQFITKYGPNCQL